MAGPGMHQSQNLSLQQVLAPQLQQSLLILQAPLLELRNLVQQEMETNPVLEELATEPNAEDAEETDADRGRRSSRRSSINSPNSMTNGAITWRNRAATAPAPRKMKKNASSSSIRSRPRRRCSSISWVNSTRRR